MTLIKGLGTRIKTLTQGIALGETHFLWVNNAHCPVDAADIFPNGVEGVEIHTVRSPSYAHQRQPRRDMIHWAEALRMVWDSLPPMDLTTYACGIHYRGFHPRGKLWLEFQDEVARFAASTVGQVFVFADSRREELVEILGDRAVLPSAQPLRFDFDRSPQQVLAHLHDWRHFVLTEAAVSNHPRPAAMWFRYSVATAQNLR
jgi:hypothetical protein